MTVLLVNTPYTIGGVALVDGERRWFVHVCACLLNYNGSVPAVTYTLSDGAGVLSDTALTCVWYDHGGQ